MADVYVYNPDGQLGLLPEEHLQGALSEGFRLESPEERRSRELDAEFGDRDVAAGLAAGARGLTFGLSDLALTKTGLVEPRTLEGLREAPGTQTANVIGEVAGAALPIVATLGGSAPASAAGTAARLAARGTPAALAATLERAAARGISGLIGLAGDGIVARGAAQIGGAVAGGATGGALYGLGRSVTEEALNGEADLTAERLIANLSEGLQFGAAAGAVGLGVEKLLGGAARGVRRLTGVKQVAEELADVPPASQIADESPGAVRARTMREAAVEQADKGLDFGPGELEDDLADAISPALEGSAKTLEGVAGYASKNMGRIQKWADRLGLSVTKEEALLRGIDAKKGQLKALRQKGLEEVAPRALLDDPRYNQILEQVGPLGSPDEAILGLIKTKAQEAVQAKNAAMGALEKAALPEELFDGSTVAQRIREKIISPLEKGTTLNRGLVGQLKAEADNIESMGRKALAEAEAYKSGLDDKIYEAASLSQTTNAKAFRQLRYEIAQETRDKAKQISERLGAPEVLQGFQEGNRLYGYMKELQKITEDRLRDAKGANRVFSLTDNLWGNAGAIAGSLAAGPIGAVGGYTLGLTGMVVNKWFREKFPFQLAGWLAKAERTASPERVAARGFHRQISKLVSEEEAAEVATRVERERSADAARMAMADGNPAAAQALLEEADPSGAMLVPGGPTTPPPQPPVPSKLGRFRNILAEAASAGELDLATTHAILAATSPEYVETMEKAGFGELHPDQDRDAYERGIQYAAIDRATESQDRALTEHVDAFLGKKGLPKTSWKRPTAEQVKEQVADLVTLAANRKALEDRMDPGGALAAVAPSVAGHVSEVAMRAVQTLQSVAPRPPDPSAVKGYGGDWSPSETELSKYAKIGRAVMRPMSLLEDMTQGSIDVRAVQAVKAVYPRLAEQMGQRYIDRAAELGSRLDHQQRILLSVLMGQPIDRNMEPGRLAAFQMRSQQATQQASSPEGTVAAGRAGKARSGTDKTVSQRLEGR